MTETITAVYERGVLRPLEPLHLPENTRVTLRLTDADQASSANADRVLKALISADVISPLQVKPRSTTDETALVAIANRLAQYGSLSEIVIRDRDDSK